MAWLKEDEEQLHKRRLNDFVSYRAQVLRMAKFEATESTKWIAVIAFISFLTIAYLLRGNTSYITWIYSASSALVPVIGIFLIRRRLSNWVNKSFKEIDDLEEAEYQRHTKEVINFEGGTI